MFHITGASGLLGQALIQELKDRSLDFCGYTRSENLSKELNLKFISDYSNLQGPGSLIHLAENKYPFNYKDQAVSAKQSQTLEKLLDQDFEQIIYASSILVYPLSDDRNHEEQSIKVEDNLHPYTKYKLEAEQGVLKHKNSIVLRLANIYAKHMPGENVFNDILAQKSNNIIKVRNQMAKRDYIFIDDVVNAIIELSLKNKTGIYNIASGKSSSVKEIIDIICTHLSKTNYKIESATNEEDSLAIDNSKLQNETNWCLNYPLEKGLEVLARTSL